MERKKVNTGKVIGIILGIIGVFTIFSDFIVGLSFLIISIVLIPKTSQFIESKLHFKFNTTIKVIIVLLCLFVIGASAGKNENQKDTPTKINIQSNQTEKPGEEITPKQKIENKVSEILNGKNNLDKNFLRKIEITDEDNNTFAVNIEFNASDNFSANLRKKGILIKMSEIYQSLYRGNMDINSAIITAHFPLIDKYGNEEDGMVYKTSLLKEEASKINWSVDSATLKLEIIPGIWNDLFIHPEFK